MKRLTVVAVLISVFVAGCAPIATVRVLEPDRFAANESKFPDRATIFVFRGTGGGGAVFSFPVTLDQTKIGAISRKQYIAFPATAGTHWLSVVCPSICGMPGYKISLDVSAGKTYYFMIEPNVTFGYNNMTSSTNLTQIDKPFADKLMLTYQVAEPATP